MPLQNMTYEAISPRRAAHIRISEAYCLFKSSEVESVSIIHVLGGEQKWGKKC